MKIPGWAFMLIGAGVVAYSKFVEAKQGANLTVFFWLGIAFLIYGGFKEIGGRLLRSRKASKNEPAGPPPTTVHPQPAYNRETHAHIKGTKHPSHPHVPAHKRCPNCHVLNGVTANFCGKCGFRF